MIPKQLIQARFIHSSMTSQKLCNGEERIWSLSNILTDKKSKFQAFSIKLNDESEIAKLLDDLKTANSKIIKSTHPTMFAWRTAKLNELGNNFTNIDQGYYDCGESGAGYKISKVLENFKIYNVLCVVTRWYGGIPLGPARFRDISSVAMESIQKGDFSNSKTHFVVDVEQVKRTSKKKSKSKRTN